MGSELPPIPDRLARRPRDARGFPIPVTVAIRPDGRPDFRVNDMHAWARVVHGRRCALCGEPMGGNVAFIGGPLSHVNRLFTDAGMHRECARFAIMACPYLAIGRVHYSGDYSNDNPPKIDGYEVAAVVDEASDQKPDRFFIGMTKAYRIVKASGSDTILIHAGAWTAVEWWRDGAPLEPGAE